MNLKGLAIAASLAFATPALSLYNVIWGNECEGQTSLCGKAQTRSSTASYTLWYDTIYDQKEYSLGNVICSSGEYGLLTAGYNVFNDLPSFPFIGGAPQIQSWDSPNCGTCWELTYIDAQGITTSLSFTAISTAPKPQGGFSISLEGMNRLTGGNAQTLDGISITATQLQASECGLS